MNLKDVGSACIKAPNLGYHPLHSTSTQLENPNNPEPKDETLLSDRPLHSSKLKTDLVLNAGIQHEMQEGIPLAPIKVPLSFIPAKIERYLRSPPKEVESRAAIVRELLQLVSVAGRIYWIPYLQQSRTNAGVKRSD